MKKVEVEMIEPGDLVLFNSGDNHGFKTTIGVVCNINLNNNYNVLSSRMTAYRDVTATDLVYASDENIYKIRKEIIAAFDKKISNLQEKIQQIAQEEECIEYLEKYKRLKEKIISVARNIAESKDDTDFENKLKDLAALKRELFFLRFNCADSLRIQSTNIQKKINDYEIKRDNILSCIDNESLQRARMVFGMI